MTRQFKTPELHRQVKEMIIFLRFGPLGRPLRGFALHSMRQIAEVVTRSISFVNRVIKQHCLE